MGINTIIQSNTFFRAALTSLKSEEIADLEAKLEREQNEIEASLIDFVWHMRGMSLNEAYDLTHRQRKHMIKAIEKRIETVEKSQLAIL